MKPFTVLVTGFDPFGGETVNPSYEAVKLLPDTLPGAVIRKLEIPTSFSGGPALLEETMRELSPEIVLCVGQAGGRANICLEKFALNCKAASIPDNSGELSHGEPLFPGEPDARSFPADLPALVRRLNSGKDGAPVFSVSYHAGTFVCNALYYHLLRMTETELPGTLGLFVHVPYLPEQIRRPGIPSMELADIRDGIMEVLAELISLRGL